jgi:hypothetical protein
MAGDARERALRTEDRVLQMTESSAGSTEQVAGATDVTSATAGAGAQPERFRLYSADFASVATYLPWAILGFALVAIAISRADVMFVSGLIAAATAGFLVRALGNSVPEVLTKVWARNLLASRSRALPALELQFAAFLGRFQGAANSHWSWALGLFFAVAAVPQFFLSPSMPDAAAVFRAAGVSGLFSVFVDWWLLGLLVVGAIGFFMGLLAWRMGCVGYYIHRLGGEFDCRIQSQHPDGAGGLGALGEVCFLNALIVIVPSIFLGAWRILITNVPTFRLAYGYLTDWFAVLLLVTFLLAIVGFVAPLYGVHQSMSREKTRRQRELDQIGNEMDRLTQRIRAAAEAGDPASVTGLTEQRAVLATVYENERDVPTWPVNTSLMRKYVVSQIVPLLSLTKVVDALASRFLGGS